MAEKSLDDKLKEAELAIKEAELAKLKSEDEKVKAETALARKQLNAKWYSGKSLAQITALVLAVVAVYTAIDKIFLAELKQKEARLAKVEAGLFQSQVDSLNRKKTSIITTIDSLKIMAIISERFGTLGSLGSLGYANVLEKYNMIVAKNYYDSFLNPNGTGIENDFKVQVIKGDTIIYDAATKLTWQGGSEFPVIDWKAAKDSVKNLVYAGFDDWRLPTLKEAMSLMEKNKQGFMYIDGRLGNAPDIWTSDKYDTSKAWDVGFHRGACGYTDVGNHYVRAVR